MYIRPYGPECITFSFVIAAAAAMETADVAVGAANAAATAVGATDITAAAAVAAGSADIAATAVVAAAATAVAAGTADTGVAAAGIAAGVGDKIREQDPGDFRTRIVTGIAGHMISSKKEKCHGRYLPRHFMQVVSSVLQPAAKLRRRFHTQCFCFPHHTIRPHNGILPIRYRTFDRRHRLIPQLLCIGRFLFLLHLLTPGLSCPVIIFLCILSKKI